MLYYRYFVATGDQARSLREQYNLTADKVPIIVAGHRNGRFFNLALAVKVGLTKEQQETAIDDKVQDWVDGNLN
jgi:hypothetical protein